MPYSTRSAALDPLDVTQTSMDDNSVVKVEVPTTGSSTKTKRSEGRTPGHPPGRGKRIDVSDSDGPELPAAKKARKSSAKEEDEPEEMIELPHNMGYMRAMRSETLTVKESTDIKQVNEVRATVTTTTVGKTKKSRKTTRNPYRITPGVTPFPDWQHPTPEECEEVNRLLSELHGETKAPAAIPAPSLTISGCGEVPSVLDALLRTVLSGATTKGNSGKAFAGLVAKFGVTDRGIGKGSVDWEKVRLAPVEDVQEAIRSGGLAAIKSKTIKEILDMVYNENLERREKLKAAARQQGKRGPVTLNDTEKYQVAELEDDLLSLNHLHCLSKNDALLQFVKYPGVGVKTAACVVLFCLQRPCFAVDTHVFRLSKWLKWLPEGKGVNEITAFSHLEVRIPDHLKYSLHQLFLEHGKTCQRCRASTGDWSDSWCPIDRLVERTGKRKGKEVTVRQTKLSLQVKTKNVNVEDEDESLSEMASE